MNKDAGDPRAFFCLPEWSNHYPCRSLWLAALAARNDPLDRFVGLRPTAALTADRARSGRSCWASSPAGLIPPDSPQPGVEVPVGTALAYLLAPGEALPAQAGQAADGAGGLVSQVCELAQVVRDDATDLLTGFPGGAYLG